MPSRTVLPASPIAFSIALTTASLALLAACATHGDAPPPAIPPSTWWRAAAPPPGACADALAEVRREVTGLPTTTLMVARGSEVLLAYGDLAHASVIASARKSLLAMLFGNAVADGRIRLDATLAELGIDDVGGLLPVEREARVRDLVAARSGVYHPAANPGDDAADAPPRGSRAPGTWFLYNNWDFNAAGTIYERATGRTIQRAFADEIATPLGLEDFDLAAQRRTGDRTRSVHRAYPFSLSTRDMARIGELMLAGGAWEGRQLVPAGWTRTITTPVTPAADMHPARRARHGIAYGDMWWLPEEAPDSPLAGSAMAWGYYGQYILVVPKAGLVIAHKRDVPPGTGIDPAVPGVGPETFLGIARRIAGACGGA